MPFQLKPAPWTTRPTANWQTCQRTNVQVHDHCWHDRFRNNEKYLDGVLRVFFKLSSKRNCDAGNNVSEREGKTPDQTQGDGVIPSSSATRNKDRNKEHVHTKLSQHGVVSKDKVCRTRQVSVRHRDRGGLEKRKLVVATTQSL